MSKIYPELTRAIALSDATLRRPRGGSNIWRAATTSRRTRARLRLPRSGTLRNISNASCAIRRNTPRSTGSRDGKACRARSRPGCGSMMTSVRLMGISSIPGRRTHERRLTEIAPEMAAAPIANQRGAEVGLLRLHVDEGRPRTPSTGSPVQMTATMEVRDAYLAAGAAAITDATANGVAPRAGAAAESHGVEIFGGAIKKNGDVRGNLVSTGCTSWTTMGRPELLRLGERSAGVHETRSIVLPKLTKSRRTRSSSLRRLPKPPAWWCARARRRPRRRRPLRHRSATTTSMSTNGPARVDYAELRTWWSFDSG